MYIERGKHEQEQEINKQLNDKERVLAALENANLLSKLHNLFSLSVPLTFNRNREQGLIPC